MDAAATVIFSSGKIRRLFEGGYHSRYAYAHIVVRTRRAKEMKLLFRQHCAWTPGLQDNVDLVFGRDYGGWRGCLLYTFCTSCRRWCGRSVTNYTVRHSNNHQLKRGVKCSLLLYRGSGHSQSFAPWSPGRRCALAGDYMNVIIYLRAATILLRSLLHVTSI